MVPRQFTKNSAKYWLQAIYIYIKNHRGYCMVKHTLCACLKSLKNYLKCHIKKVKRRNLLYRRLKPDP